VGNKKTPKRKKSTVPVPGKISTLTEEEVKELIIKPAAGAKPIFDYLAQWRSQSLKSSFSFS
jgi:hypothetical protein